MDSTYFHLMITGQLKETLPEEPNDFDFIRMLNEQEEKQNGRRQKTDRNYHRGKRKTV